MNASLLREMIEALIAEELTVDEEETASLSEFAPASNPLAPSEIPTARKKRTGASIGSGFDTGDMSGEDFERFLRVLVKRKYGRATLQRSDMEKLDKLTRWMQYLPLGHQYRRGLAKYLRSKQDKVKRDPFKDFRQYRYDNNEG